MHAYHIPDCTRIHTRRLGCWMAVNRCIDVDCGVGGTCSHELAETVLGKYLCTCAFGFEGGGAHAPCSDTNECLGVDCGDGGTCSHEQGDAEGDYTCTCDAGWTGGGENAPCVDVDECVVDAADCGAGGTCKHAVGEQVVGQYTCECEAGYSGGGVSASCVENRCDRFAFEAGMIGGEQNGCTNGSCQPPTLPLACCCTSCILLPTATLEIPPTALPAVTKMPYSSLCCLAAVFLMPFFSCGVCPRRHRAFHSQRHLLHRGL